MRKVLLNLFKTKFILNNPLTIATRDITTTMTPSNASSKLVELRKLMEKHNLAAYYIPSEDAHQVNNSKSNFFDLLVCRVSTFLNGTVEEHL